MVRVFSRRGSFDRVRDPSLASAAGRNLRPTTHRVSFGVSATACRETRDARRGRAGGGRRPPSTAERSGRSGRANEGERARIAFERVLASPSSPTSRVRRVGASLDRRFALNAPRPTFHRFSVARHEIGFAVAEASVLSRPPLTTFPFRSRPRVNNAGFEVLGRR